MSRQTVRSSLIISVALTLVAATAYSAESTERFDRTAFQAELAPLSADARTQAAQVGVEIANRALAVTHCVTLQPQRKLAASRRAQAESS